ncbi:hypothetical protein PIB30_000478 [Stylosanthes scabra]|uniref:Uncharacterized protein n=1 Tax=Stylosanthes scabra TaxID=79078 RepID=A0ABU6V382_9FABA|nr:hypothetical protein [Stylosanthes scabra]
MALPTWRRLQRGMRGWRWRLQRGGACAEGASYVAGSTNFSYLAAFPTASIFVSKVLSLSDTTTSYRSSWQFHPHPRIPADFIRDGGLRGYPLSTRGARGSKPPSPSLRRRRQTWSSSSPSKDVAVLTSSAIACLSSTDDGRCCSLGVFLLSAMVWFPSPEWLSSPATVS